MSHALQKDKYGVDRWSRGQTSSPQTWISEQEAALHYSFQPCWTPGGRHSATITSRHYTETVLQKGVEDWLIDWLIDCFKSSKRMSRSSDQTWEHTIKNIVTPWQCCSRQSKGHNSLSGGRKVTSSAPPTPQPWLSPMWLLVVFYFENWPCWKEVFCELKTLQER